MKKFLRGISFYILIIIIIYMFVLIIQNAEPAKDKLSYTQLVAEIESGRIKEITVSIITACLFQADFKYQTI